MAKFRVGDILTNSNRKIRYLVEEIREEDYLIKLRLCNRNFTEITYSTHEPINAGLEADSKSRYTNCCQDLTVVRRDSFPYWKRLNESSI